MASALAGDALLGRISGSSEIRAAARQFREEAAYLEMPTKNLIPNIEHVYREWDTSQSPNQQSSAQFRKFQTDPNGLVVDTPDETHHKVMSTTDTWVEKRDQATLRRALLSNASRTIRLT